MLEDIMECARAAGEAALRYFRAPASVLHSNNKFNDSDIVTEADLESDRIIREFVARKYPDHSILSEESGLNDVNSEWEWVIDPVDGTTNFFAGLPYWAVSIGVKQNGETRFGVVYAPALGEMFAAERGCGATMNGKTIRCSSETLLSRSVICTGFPVDKDRNPDCNADNFLKLLPRVRGMRRLGSSAVDTVYTAAGFLDAYWELGLHEWDICAATLIAREAGCIVTTIRQDKPISILVAPEELTKEILPLISTEPCRAYFN